MDGGRSVMMTEPLPLLKLRGAGEWLVEKHGTKRHRSWRKMHLGVDADTRRIVVATLTERDVDDAAQLRPLLDQVEDPVAAIVADDAYDRESVYADVAERHPEAAISRYKHVIGDGLRLRIERRRAVEVDVGVHALNRMLKLGRPNYTRVA